MNRIILGLILGLTIMLFAGCVKVSSHVTLNLKGGGEVEYLFAIDESLQQMAGGFGGGMGLKTDNPFAKMKEAFAKDGFTVVDYKDGKNVGLKAVKKAKNTAEIMAAIQTKALASNQQLSKGSGGLFDTLGKSLKIDKKLFTTTYHLDAIVDMGADKADTTKPGDPASEVGRRFGESMASSMFDFSFALTLPVKPKSTNASTISADGRTLEWQLKPGEKNKLQAELTVPNLPNIATAFVLLFILIVIVAIQHRKSQGNKVIEADQTTNDNNYDFKTVADNQDNVIKAKSTITESNIDDEKAEKSLKEQKQEASSSNNEAMTKSKMENDASEND